MLPRTGTSTQRGLSKLTSSGSWPTKTVERVRANQSSLNSGSEVPCDCQLLKSLEAQRNLSLLCMCLTRSLNLASFYVVCTRSTGGFTRLCVFVWEDWGEAHLENAVAWKSAHRANIQGVSLLLLPGAVVPVRPVMEGPLSTAWQRKGKAENAMLHLVCAWVFRSKTRPHTAYLRMFWTS